MMETASQTVVMEKPKSSQVLPDFFDKDPALKERLVNYLQGLSDEEKRHSVQLFRKFVSGEMTWAEVRGIPKVLLKELAHQAYQLLKMKDYKRSEIIFKGLSIIDHSNWYYRAALGTVYQRQGQYEKAVEEYSYALDINPDESTSLVSRGECYMKLGDNDSALEDFMRIQESGLPAESLLRKRVKVLSERILGK